MHGGDVIQCGVHTYTYTYVYPAYVYHAYVYHAYVYIYSADDGDNAKVSQRRRLGFPHSSKCSTVSAVWCIHVYAYVYIHMNTYVYDVELEVYHAYTPTLI